MIFFVLYLIRLLKKHLVIDDYHKRINELAYGLEHISGEKVVSFNLELRSPDMNKIDAEIKRLEEILLNN